MMTARLALLILLVQYCDANVTLADLAGCWENTTTGNPPYNEYAIVLNNNKNQVSQWISYSVTSRTDGRQESSVNVFNSQFNPSSGQLSFSVFSTFFKTTFTDVSFDQLNGSSTGFGSLGSNSVYRLRRPNPRAVVCKESTPPRPTSPPTPMPPTTPTTTTTTTTTTSTLTTSTSSVQLFSTFATSSSSGSTVGTAGMASGSDSANGVISMDSQASDGVGNNEDASPIDATGIGLIVAGVVLFIISALILCCVIAKRRRAASAANNDKPEAAPVSPNAPSGQFGDNSRAYSSVNLVIAPSLVVGEYGAGPPTVSGGDSISAGSSSGGSYSPMPMRP